MKPTNDFKALLTLLNLSAPSGHEQRVREFLKKEMEKYVDEIKIDNFGNLICMKKGKGAKAMLMAHMDEIGLMVKSIDKNGYIFCSEIGFMEPITLLGERVLVDGKNNSKIPGVISTRQIMNDDEIKKLPKVEDLIVDTGLSREELDKAGVNVGNYVHIVLPSIDHPLIGKDRLVTGKSLDDRLGCFILLEVAKRLKNVKHNIVFIFTVQEEVGLYGGKTSIYGQDPSWVIVVDTSASNESLDNPTIAVGNGPSIMVKDAEMVTNHCLNEWLIAIGKEKNIPHQLEVTETGTTDALVVSVSKGGIPTTVLSVPVRNMHTSIGIASLKDIQRSIDMLTELLKKEPKTCTI